MLDQFIKNALSLMFVSLLVSGTAASAEPLLRGDVQARSTQGGVLLQLYELSADASRQHPMALVTGDSGQAWILEALTEMEYLVPGQLQLGIAQAAPTRSQNTGWVHHVLLKEFDPLVLQRPRQARSMYRHYF